MSRTRHWMILAILFWIVGVAVLTVFVVRDGDWVGLVTALVVATVIPGLRWVLSRGREPVTIMEFILRTRPEDLEKKPEA